MKKNILLSLLFFAIGCSSDSESDNNQNTGNLTLKLVKVVEVDYLNDDVFTTNITYKNGIVDKALSTDKSNKEYMTEFIYSDGKLQRENYYENLVPKSYQTYSYEGDVIRSMLSFEDNIYFVHKYSYNSKGQIFKEEQFSDDKLDATNTFEYNSDGNISKEIYSNDRSTSYQYDKKKNPLYLLFSDSVLKTYGSLGSKNNIISDSDNYSYDYTYNSQGFPTEVIEKYDGVVESKTTYTYE